MGKKGSWLSAIKRAFTHNSKENRADGGDKKGKGILRRRREPSSIEKILGEADQLLIRPPTYIERPKSPPSLPICAPEASIPKAPSPEASTPKAASPEASTPKANPPPTFSTAAVSSKVKQSKKEIRYEERAKPSLRDQQLSATKIQAAYRGYMARRSFRSLKGLVRLQGVVKGQNVKRQMVNAMKQMQLLVRVQSQIQSRRIQMLENHTSDKESESSRSKFTLNQLFEAGRNEDWDDSSLTKEEVEARRRNKVEAVVKRERAMAYSYSHKLWKSNPKSLQTPSDIGSNASPWWWNRLQLHLAKPNKSRSQTPSRNAISTPPRLTPHSIRSKLASPVPKSPQSATSAIPFRSKQFQTTPNRATTTRLKDDDSLVSCPPFSMPNYMTPTASAKAKSRANSNPRDRFPATPGSVSSRRFSFPFTPNAGSFRWMKGSDRDSPASRSVGEFSIDSTVSVPVGLIGRRPFNRFV